MVPVVEASAETRWLIELMNTWRIPNDTRSEEDHLEDWMHDLDPAPSGAAGQEQIGELRGVRDCLRQLVEGHPEPFDDLLQTSSVAWQLEAGRARVTRTSERLVDLVIERTARAALSGELRRLKTCADCRWAFFDTTRNNSRTWCAMTAGPGRRGCGAIAKSRRYRDKTREQDTSSSLVTF